MATAANQFRPDYAVPPGWILEERLEVHGMSQAEFARRCGRSAKLISEIIAGKAPLEPETAIQFEKVLGVDADLWLSIESGYQLHRAREADAARAKDAIAWSKTFPINDLVKRRCFPKPVNPVDAVSKLLAFFGVGSLDAWNSQYGLAKVAYRHSPSFKSNEVALATWLRLGELDAEQQECADYSETQFKLALKQIRALTREPVEQAIPLARALCNEAGVAIALVPPLAKTALSGAAWWISPRKPVIQLSARHKSDDHLWFSFFHEAAHILLHSKKSVFVDDKSRDGTDEEKEADAWACNTLVPTTAWRQFVATGPRSERAVLDFADSQGIAPGIVVGMLQHSGILPWTHLNGLKIRLKWSTGAED